MKILLLITFVIVGSAPIFARPSAASLNADSEEYYDFNTPTRDDEKDYVAFEKSYGDYDGFKKYWSKPIKQLYVEEEVSTQATDTSTPEMSGNEGNEFAAKHDKDDDYVFVDKDAVPDTIGNINFLNSLSDDSKVIAKKEISSGIEPLSSRNYFAYQLSDNWKDDANEEGAETKDQSGGDKSDFLMPPSNEELHYSDENRKFSPPLREILSLSDWEEGKEEETSNNKDVMPLEVIAATPIPVIKEEVHYSGVNRQFYGHDYISLGKQLTSSDWNDGEEFVFIKDKLEESDESDEKDVAKDEVITSGVNRKFYGHGFPPLREQLAAANSNNVREQEKLNESKTKDVMPSEVLATTLMPVGNHEEHNYGVNRKFDGHSYAPLRALLSSTDWNDGKEFVFIEDKQEESDESDENDVVLATTPMAVGNHEEQNSGVKKKLYSHSYPALRDWNDGKEFVIMQDTQEDSDESDVEDGIPSFLIDPNEKMEHSSGWKTDGVVAVAGATRNERDEEDIHWEFDEDDDDDEEENSDESDEDEESEEDQENGEDQESDANQESEEDSENEEVQESEETQENEEDQESEESDGEEVNKDLQVSSVEGPSYFRENITPLLSQLAVSSSNSELLVNEHQANLQDFLMTQKQLNDTLIELNYQNEMTFEKFFSTANERNDYNGQQHRALEKDMNEMLRNVDQIKGRIIEMQRIEQKHNYHMLLNALLKEIYDKTETL